MTWYRWCWPTLPAASETYRGEASLYTWLCQICRREVAKHIAGRARHAAVLTFSQDSELDEAVNNLSAPATEEPEAVTRRAELIAGGPPCVGPAP